MGFFDFLDSNNHVLAKIDSGKLYDRNNHVIGKITWGGDVQDANNHTLGHISSSGEVRTDGIANWGVCLAMVTFLMPTIISLVALIHGEL